MFKIVIADDDTDTLSLYSDIFPKNEFHVTLMEDGQLALKAIERLNPDLVILDAIMPGFGGIDILRCLAKTTQNPISFLVTGQTLVAGKEAYEHNAHLYLKKPVDPEDLYAAARRFLRTRPDPNPMHYLSNREKQILLQLTLGRTNSEIGDALHISPKTVAKHRENMMGRYEAKNVADLIMKTGAYSMVRR